MEETKYGVSVTALKKLKEFQFSLKSKKRNGQIPANMPFVNMCLVSINDSEAVLIHLCADVGIATIGDLDTLNLRHGIQSMVETATTVTFYRSNHPITKIRFSFKDHQTKTMFIETVGRFFDDSSASEESTDSGI